MKGSFAPLVKIKRLIHGVNKDEKLIHAVNNYEKLIHAVNDDEEVHSRRS